MTMIDIGGEVTATGGSLSANALAVGGDSKLVFQMENSIPTGLFVVSRRMKITKIAAAAQAMIAGSSLPSSEVQGNFKVQRGNTVVAQINFSIPPSGQIPAAAPTMTQVADPASTITKDITKGWHFAAARVDPSGSTPVATATPAQWLGAGSSVYRWYFSLDVDSNDANNTKTPPNRTIQLVGYDATTDKEMTPQQIVLNPALGPFSSDDISSNVSVGAGFTGNIPVGTVVQFQPVLQFPNGRRVTAGAQKSFTVTETGSVSVSCPMNATAYISSQYDGVGLNAHANGHSMIRYCQYGVLYKLSTQSGWTFMAGTNQPVQINNTFPDGGQSMPPATTTFTGVSGITMYGKISPRPDIPNWSTRVTYKVFALKSGTWYQVFGAGATEIDLSKPQWPYGAYSSTGWDGNFADAFSMDLDAVYSSYPDTELRYAPRNPRGDQFYVAGEKVGFDISVPSRFGVTGLKLYAAQATADSSGNVGSAGTWQLIYDGPYVSTFRWLGVIINNSPTLPNTNTTATYASLSGQVGWPAADPTEVIIEPGDSIVVVRTAGSGPVITQLSMPVEFIE